MVLLPNCSLRKCEKEEVNHLVFHWVLAGIFWLRLLQMFQVSWVLMSGLKIISSNY